VIPDIALAGNLIRAHQAALLVNHDAAPERRIVITDDFGQRVQISADQFRVLVEEARSGRLDEVLAGLSLA
jgi:hypothetical protein